MQDLFKEILDAENALPDVIENPIYGQMLTLLKGDNRLQYYYSTHKRLLHLIDVYVTQKDHSFQIRADVSTMFGFNIALFGGGEEWYFEEQEINIDLIREKIYLMASSLYFAEMFDADMKPLGNTFLFSTVRPTTDDIKEVVCRNWVHCAEKKFVICFDFFDKEIATIDLAE
jgi:hypothetical protein